MLGGNPAFACANWTLACNIYTVSIFDDNCASIVPLTILICPLSGAYCSSAEFNASVRQIDQTLKVTNATLVKVPFDLDHWTKVAKEKYPNGLPKPYSDDPTQWIFHGHPCGSVVWDEETKWTAHGPLRNDKTVLQVAVARLLGYRWPAELDDNMELADEQREWVKRCDSCCLMPMRTALSVSHPCGGRRLPQTVCLICWPLPLAMLGPMTH